MLTEEGKSTIALFHKQISDAIKQEVSAYLREHAIELRNEVSVTGQYQRVSSKSYETVLRATERGELLMELKILVPDEKTATAVCEQWQKKNEDIYALVMKELF